MTPPSVPPRPYDALPTREDLAYYTNTLALDGRPMTAQQLSGKLDALYARIAQLEADAARSRETPAPPPELKHGCWIHDSAREAGASDCDMCYWRCPECGEAMTSDDKKVETEHPQDTGRRLFRGVWRCPECETQIDFERPAPPAPTSGVTVEWFSARIPHGINCELRDVQSLLDAEATCTCHRPEVLAAIATLAAPAPTASDEDATLALQLADSFADGILRHACTSAAVADRHAASLRRLASRVPTTEKPRDE